VERSESERCWYMMMKTRKEAGLDWIGLIGVGGAGDDDADHQSVLTHDDCEDLSGRLGD